MVTSLVTDRRNCCMKRQDGSETGVTDGDPHVDALGADTDVDVDLLRELVLERGYTAADAAEALGLEADRVVCALTRAFS
jgi:hypothetical protein